LLAGVEYVVMSARQSPDAELLAALYRVLAATPGIRLLGRTLAHRSRLSLDGKQPPGLNFHATFLATGVVTSTRARVP
jgi:hypothetical protein